MLDVWSWLPFGTQWITTSKVVFGNSGTLPLAILPALSSSSIAGRLLPCLPLFLTSQTSLEHFFKNIPTHCHWIHLAFSKFSKGSQVSTVSKKSYTAVSRCRCPSRSCFKRFCPRIRDRCFFPRNPATHTIFHLLKVLKLGWPIRLANCFKENSICFKLIGALPLAPPQSDKSSLAYSASYSSYRISGNGGKSPILATSVLRDSTTSWNGIVGRLMGGLPAAPGICPYGVEAEVVGKMTGMFPGGAGGTQGAPGDDSPCPVKCWGGNIRGPP